MIYEYAIDPEFLLDLLNETQIQNNIIRACRQGIALFSNYPELFGASGFKRLSEQEKTSKDFKLKASIQKKKLHLAELQKHISNTNVIQRFNLLKNSSFELEHAEHPFHVILTNAENPNNLPYKNIDWLKKLDCEFFSHDIGRDTLTVKEDLKENLKPLLQNASKITFIDPYFFTNPEYKKTYEAYFKLIDKTTNIRCEDKLREITIICTGEMKNKNSIPYDEFKNSCLSVYSSILSENMKLKIYRIITKKQKVHDRLILTDIGGVTLGYGTGENEDYKESETIISVLSQSSLANWRNKYTPDSEFFQWEEPITILYKENK